MTINVGLVGYGLSGAVFHAPLIQNVKGMRLAAVVTSRPEQVLADYPDVTIVSTPEQLFQREEIDLIVVATPNTTHYPFAKQAMLAGKHVVVEKPFTITSGEADELVELARSMNVVLSVYQNRRWDNDFLTVQHLLETGVLGELSLYEAHFDRFRPLVRDRWREQDIPGAGILYDLGAHLIDQALVLFGLPKTVWAEVEIQRSGGKSDDFFHLVLDYGRMKAVLHSSSLVREPGPRIQLHGSKGSFLKHGLDPQEDQLKRGIHPGDPGYGEEPESMYGHLVHSLGDLTLKSRVSTLPGRYQAYYEGIAEAIVSGRPAPVTAAEARDVIRVIECAKRSSEEKRAVPMM